MEYNKYDILSKESLKNNHRLIGSFVDTDVTETFCERLYKDSNVFRRGFNEYDKNDAVLFNRYVKDLMNSKFGLLRPLTEIENVIFNDPATIVFWKDGIKTVVKCGKDEVFDPEKGLAMAIAKRAFGNMGNYYEVFKKWLPEEEKDEEYSYRIQESINRIKKNIQAALGRVDEKRYTIDEITKAFGFNETYTKFRLNQFEESRQ